MIKILPGILLIVLAVFAAIQLFPSIKMQQLTVVTVPSGAIVSINGLVVGLTPYTRLVPTNGVHVLVQKEGFFEVDSLVDLEIDSLFLQLKEGALLIVNTTPVGCDIVAEDFMGVSPCSIEVVSGSSFEVTAMGEMGISVNRSINILTPRTRIINICVPFEVSDSIDIFKFVTIPSELLPFPMSDLTVGQSEVTAAQFSLFLNSVDPYLYFDSNCVLGRTVLMDSILKSNWHGPVGFNEDTTAYAPLPDMASYPMVGVTQEGADWFCSWLSATNSFGFEFRLPTFREWELLASYGTHLPVNLSDINEVILKRHPELNDGWAETAPAGAMGTNRLGLSEMQGNVWEWTNSIGTAIGGSWLSSASDCSESSRIELGSQLGYPFVGFRVIATGFPTGNPGIGD